MCKGPYVILQGGSPIEKANNVSFILIIWSLGFSLKGDIKGLFFSKEREKPFYTDQRIRFFSLLLREKFSRASCFGSDKGAHTSSADRT